MHGCIDKLECTKWLIFCSQIVHVIWWNVFFILLTNGNSIFFRLFKITHRNAIHVSVYKIVCITNIWHHKKTISHGLFAVALGTSILAFYEYQILNWLFAGWLFMNLCAYKSMCDCVWVFYYFDVFAAAL